MAYATTLQLAAILGIKADIPSWDVAGTPTKEEVGTGDDSTTVFYLDQQHVIASSYTLYYGASESNVTALVETTHYTLAKDTGIITLTGTGVTVVSTNKIYAEYSYFSNGMDDSYLTTVIARADLRVNKKCNTSFTDGTATNPSYPSTVEIQDSKGIYDNVYFTRQRPLIDVNSTLASDITSSDTSLDVATDDGANFPSTGTIIIGTEKITYTGVSTDTLTGLTRGVGDSTAAAHSEDDEVHTTILESSGTEEGTAPTWTVQEWKADMFGGELGQLFLYGDLLVDYVSRTQTLLSKNYVANRIKVTYLYGFDTIPIDITRLSLLIAKQMLINDTIGKALIAGRNEFRPEMLSIDDAEISAIIGTYRQAPMGNT